MPDCLQRKVQSNRKQKNKLLLLLELKWFIEGYSPIPPVTLKKLKSRKQGAISELLYSFCWSQIFPRSQVLKVKLMLNVLFQHSNGLAHVDLKGTNKPFDIKIWRIYMVYRFNYNNLVSDSIFNKFFYLRLEGESQCITLHLLPVCDIIGQTHILHIHYFLCVFSQSNGINCTFACRNLFITYNYIVHGTIAQWSIVVLLVQSFNLGFAFT